MVCRTGKLLHTFKKQINEKTYTINKMRTRTHLILLILSVSRKVEILIFLEARMLAALLELVGSKEEALRECRRLMMFDFLYREALT